MNIKDKEKFLELYNTSPEYKVVRENEKVKNNLHILCLSGSHAYGTSRPDSDVDIRGIVDVSMEYKLGVLSDWGTLTFSDTDTVIYSYKKFLHLIESCNPDTLVLLGQDKDDYLYLSELGEFLLDNYTVFLTPRNVYNSFVGYSNAQLRRLQLAELGRLESINKDTSDMKLSILNNAVYNMDTKYVTFDNHSADISFDISTDGEVSLNKFLVENISVNDFFEVARDIKNITSSFGQKGKRNNKKTDFKLNKHCMHLIRGMRTGTEVLETGKVRTYRKDDLPLLMSILHGEFMNSDGKMNSSFYDLVEEERRKADYAFEHTVIPMEVDMKKIMDINYQFMSYKFGLN